MSDMIDNVGIYWKETLHELSFWIGCD